jgi:NitT/TauT family transport system permease protein
MKGTLGPVLTILTVILAIWYVACVPMNVREVLTQAERDGATIAGGTAAERVDAPTLGLIFQNLDHLGQSWSYEQPRLPSPHQVIGTLYEVTIGEEVFSRRGIVQSGEFSTRSLITQGWITLSTTFVGFLIGAGLGIALAVGIVHNRAMDMSVMPWAIISQTIPIVAIAPMIIIVLNSVGVQGLIPKAMISAYLSFFPVVVGMVKGLRTPDPMQMDQMHTWNASGGQVLWKLRLPSSVPYLFASMKIAIAAALVGTIVGELPVQRGGLGAYIFQSSYYSQTPRIWAALIVAALLAAALVGVMGWIERRTLRAMGMGRG